MKLFKTIALFIILLLVGATFDSCSDDDDNDKIQPIRINDGLVGIGLSYPSNPYICNLTGGDGNYTVESNDKEVVTVEMNSSVDFKINVIALGETTITITDQSQNTETLSVTVDYRNDKFAVKHLDITIVGDLTENEKKAISEKYLSQVPVKVNGGYKFIYSEAPYDKGTVTIYPDVYEDKGVETTFEMKKTEYDYPNISNLAYEIVIDGEKRTFFRGYYKPSTRESEVRPKALMEDITAKVQVDYPNVKSVYTSQVVEYQW